MATTYFPIATTTLGSAAATISFTSIPATYTDLRVVFVGKVTAISGSTFFMRYNSDTGANYSFTSMYGNGSSALSEAPSALTGVRSSVDFSDTIPTYFAYDIFSYAGSTFKTTLGEWNTDRNGDGFVQRQVALWRNTAAITRIDITTSSSTYATGTTATLYGILKA